MKWPMASLKAISCFGPQYGANASAIARTGARPRYVRITDVDSNGRLLADGPMEADLNDDREFLLENGDLLFARSGNTVGKVYRHNASNGPCVFAGYLIRFRPAPELADSRFVFFFTQTAGYRSWVAMRKRVGGQPNVNGPEYAGLQLPLPALKEQRRIVELLEQADGLRRQRTEADTLADRILPALFRSMFGDPAANPKGWRSKPLARAVQMASGGTPSKANPEFWNGSIPWVSPKDMKSLVISHTEDHITVDAVENSATSVISRGSVMIVVRSGILAHSVPVAMADEAMAINQDLKALIPNRDEVDPCYLLAWLLASKQTLLGCVKRGATVHSIDSGKFQALAFMVPPKPAQESFAGHFKVLLDLQARQRAAGESVERLFATMLHRAFTGELTARWREAHLKELLAEMEQQARLLKSPLEE